MSNVKIVNVGPIAQQDIDPANRTDAHEHAIELGVILPGENMPRFLEPGDVFKLHSCHRVRVFIPKHFLCSDSMHDWELAAGSVAAFAGPPLSIGGTYIVTHTQMDGGHGDYADGHHVFCVNADTGMKVDFWQSGQCDPLNSDIEPVGKAECKWIIEDKS